jgi:hypothetical protein
MRKIFEENQQLVEKNTKKMRQFLLEIWKLHPWNKGLLFLSICFSIFQFIRDEPLGPDIQEKLQILRFIPDISYKWYLILFLFILLIHIFEGTYHIIKKRENAIFELKKKLDDREKKNELAEKIKKLHDEYGESIKKGKQDRESFDRLINEIKKLISNTDVLPKAFVNTFYNLPTSRYDLNYYGHAIHALNGFLGADLKSWEL